MHHKGPTHLLCGYAGFFGCRCRDMCRGYLESAGHRGDVPKAGRTPIYRELYSKEHLIMTEKVAITVGDMYQVLEVWYPYYRINENGLEINFIET